GVPCSTRMRSLRSHGSISWMRRGARGVPSAPAIFLRGGGVVGGDPGGWGGPFPGGRGRKFGGVGGGGRGGCRGGGGGGGGGRGGDGGVGSEDRVGEGEDFDAACADALPGGVEAGFEGFLGADVCWVCGGRGGGGVPCSVGCELGEGFDEGFAVGCGWAAARE